MFCRKCGQELKEGAKFCTKCGTAVKVPGQPTQQSQPTRSPQPTQPAQPTRPSQPTQPAQPTRLSQPKQQSVTEMPKKVSQTGAAAAPKKKKNTGIIAALAACIVVLLVLIVVLLFVIKGKMESVDNDDRDDRSDRIEKVESTEIREESTEVEENTEDAANDTEATEENPSQQEMTLEQYGENLSKCALEGVQYQYEPDANYPNVYVTKGLKGVSGCLTYTVEDVDADGMEELLAFQLIENSETGNDIFVQVYEMKENGIELADETLMVGSVYGSFCDSGDIRIFLKDKSYICLDFSMNTFLAADGVSLGFRVFTYDGTKLAEYLVDDVSGSDFYDSGRYHTDTLQKLRAMNMPKTADNVELRDNYSFCMADTGIEMLGKIRVDNSYSYTESTERAGAPVATCHWISGKTAAEEYILPQSAESYLTEQQLADLSAEQLRIARNEIYARYGWSFDDEGLREHFKNQSWYATGCGANVDDAQLSELEKANRDLIKSFEDAK